MPTALESMSFKESSSLTIRQGRIDLSFHQVVGEVFANVLKDPRWFIGSKTDVNVEVSSASHPDSFAALQNDQIDILVGWFDGSHGTYVQPFRQDVVILGDRRQTDFAQTPAIYNPYCVWAVPSYVPEQIVPDVESLADPAISARFPLEGSENKRILQGIAPGAGISRFSQEMVESYGLKAQGWEFRPGSQPDCFNKVERCIEKGEWFVVPLWHPQYLHSIHGLRALKESKGLLRPVDEARLVLSKKFLAKLSQTQQNILFEVLSRVTLGNSAVTLMDKYVHVDKLSYQDAALRWIRENQTRFDSWFESGHVDIVERSSEVQAYLLPKENFALQRVLSIPNKAPAAAGAYSAFSISSNNLIHTSFQLPWELDHNLPQQNSSPRLAYVGPVRNSSEQPKGQTISEQEAFQSARICALNILAQLRDAAQGDLSRVQLLRLEGYVAVSQESLASQDLVNVPKILDAASLLIKHALGPKQGAHARTALIFSQNPLNVPVMLGAVAELRW